MLLMLRKIRMSLRVLMKVNQKHQASYEEIEQCFLNRKKGFLEDTRVEHLSIPPTLWFITETDFGRRLKIVFMVLKNGHYEIKTAYEPNLNEERIYEKYA